MPNITGINEQNVVITNPNGLNMLAAQDLAASLLELRARVDIDHEGRGAKVDEASGAKIEPGMSLVDITAALIHLAAAPGDAIHIRAQGRNADLVCDRLRSTLTAHTQVVEDFSTLSGPALTAARFG